MRTDEWFKTRIPRAVERIRHDVAERRLSLDTLFRAMAEITDDPPSGDSARVLAEALGCLRVDEYRFLLGEVHHFLRQQADCGIGEIDDLLKTRPKGDAVEPPLVSDCRAAPRWSMGQPLLAAGYLQALLWAVLPPDQDCRICY
jgi:hypothetical protein